MTGRPALVFLFVPHPIVLMRLQDCNVLVLPCFDISNHCLVLLERCKGMMSLVMCCIMCSGTKMLYFATTLGTFLPTTSIASSLERLTSEPNVLAHFRLRPHFPSTYLIAMRSPTGNSQVIFPSSNLGTGLRPRLTTRVRRVSNEILLAGTPEQSPACYRHPTHPTSLVSYC